MEMLVGGCGTLHKLTAYFLNALKVALTKHVGSFQLFHGMVH